VYLVVARKGAGTGKPFLRRIVGFASYGGLLLVPLRLLDFFCGLLFLGELFPGVRIGEAFICPCLISFPPLPSTTCRVFVLNGL
jgi:hypothetical protein